MPVLRPTEVPERQVDPARADRVFLIDRLPVRVPRRAVAQHALDDARLEVTVERRLPVALDLTRAHHASPVRKRGGMHVRDGLDRHARPRENLGVEQCHGRPPGRLQPEPWGVFNRKAARALPCARRPLLAIHRLRTRAKPSA